MTLESWLERNDKTLAWLAGELGLSVGSASRIVNGRQNPTLAAVGVVERITNGAVTPADMLATFRAAQPAAAA